MNYHTRHSFCVLRLLVLSGLRDQLTQQFVHQLVLVFYLLEYLFFLAVVLRRTLLLHSLVYLLSFCEELGKDFG